MNLKDIFNIKIIKIYNEKSKHPTTSITYSTFLDKKEIGFTQTLYYKLKNATSENMIESALEKGMNLNSKISEISCFYPLGHISSEIKPYLGHGLGKIMLNRCMMDFKINKTDLIYTYSTKKHFIELIKKNNFDEFYDNNFYKIINPYN